MEKEKYRYLLPRIIEWKKLKKMDKDKEKIEKEKIEIEIRKFLLGVKDENKKNLLESVYLNNFYYAKNKEELVLLFNILKAMDIVDRKFFVLPQYKEMAYMDTALPIGYEQTLSQPTTVARMLMILFEDLNKKIKKEKIKNKKIKVYEIGAGSGWNAAVMACLLNFYTKRYEVFSVDRIEGLVKLAKKNIGKLEEHLKNKSSFLKKIKIDFADGFEYVKNKKFDFIIFTAGIYNKEIESKVEEIAKNNLIDNGRVICPETYGKIFIYEKEKGKIKLRKTEEEYAFVPLLSGTKK